MKRDLDTIKFEDRSEIQTLLLAIGKFVNQNPIEKENDILKSFYNNLNIMNMEW